MPGEALADYGAMADTSYINPNPNRNTATTTTVPHHPPPTSHILPKHNTNDQSSTHPRSSKPTTRISPGLALRLQRLDEQTRRLLAKHWRTAADFDIGRIPPAQLAELEQRLLRDDEERRAGVRASPPTTTTSTTMPSGRGGGGGVRLSGGPALSETELSSVLESDINSSPISLGTRLVPSDSEEDRCDAFVDERKYRLPEVGKTRLHLRTKEPLSPSPAPGLARADSRRGSLGSGPVTPREEGRRSVAAESDGMEDSPREDNGWANNNNNGSSENVSASESDWVGAGLSRAGSVYSLGRASFTGQLSQLTAMKLPDADSLARRISSIPTSTEAARALADATEQIMLWIGKASEALGGLNAEDDVDWAAAGGREGIEDVDGAIGRFEKLVQVYIVAIEKLQTRDDVSLLSADELNGSVKQLEGVLVAWQKIKSTLKGIKQQVEIAMEWEELWSSVLGEIAQEMEALNRLVFEMEEKRHEGAESLLASKENLDLSELETIVEERPGQGKKIGRLGVLPPFSPSSPLQPSEQADSKEDASLLALFARMQPLRASLDFLPMRLSTFHIRGNAVFPSACEDLEKRRDQLEEQWKKLEDDSEALRRELGEDRWVLVFRNAGRQALKMCESVARSFVKLKEGIDTGEHQFNITALNKKIESYEVKVQHYGPAIERVLAIIDKGVLDRLTVNGEILRLQSDMKRRWSSLQDDIKDMELVLNDINREARERQLRDSVSTVVSSERSIGSSLLDTPGSSPASSVANMSRKSSFQGSSTPTPLSNTKTRKAAFTPVSLGRSTSRIPSSSSSAPRRTPLSHFDLRSSPSPSPSIAITPPSSSTSTLTWASRTQPQPDNRPRWSSVGKPLSRDFAPLSKYEPSPYAKTPITPKPYIPKPALSGRRTPQTTSRIVSEPSPATHTRPPSAAFSRNETPASRKSSLPVPATPTSAAGTGRPESAFAHRRPPSSLRAPEANGRLRRSSMLPVPPSFRDGNDADSEAPAVARRPPSALAGRRTPSAMGGRRSSALPARAGSRLDDGGGEGRPRWR